MQPIASPFTHVDAKRHSCAGRFALDRKACRECLELERQVCADDARGTSLVPPGEKNKMVGTKMVRRLLDDAGGHRFSGLQN